MHVDSTDAVTQRLIRQDRAIVWIAAGTLLIGLWAYLTVTHTPGGTHHHMLTTEHGRFELARVGSAFVFWMTMMVAMMLPPVLPWILLFTGAARRNDTARTPHVRTALFVSGYFAVWALFCLPAAAAQVFLQDRLWLSTAAMKTGPYVGAALLIAAGLFQFSPLKQACLKHCRSPLSFILSGWRDDARGALTLGLRHGFYCLTCCWALMTLSFALGVMNLVWMVILTLVLCVEKIAPGGRAWSRVGGAGLFVWGLWLLM